MHLNLLYLYNCLFLTGKSRGSSKCIWRTSSQIPTESTGKIREGTGTLKPFCLESSLWCSCVLCNWISHHPLFAFSFSFLTYIQSQFLMHMPQLKQEILFKVRQLLLCIVTFFWSLWLLSGFEKKIKTSTLVTDLVWPSEPPSRWTHHMALTVGSSEF